MLSLILFILATLFGCASILIDSTFYPYESAALFGLFAVCLVAGVIF
jgi:hypothetical protein